jgi:hypothetical protein
MRAHHDQTSLQIHGFAQDLFKWTANSESAPALGIVIMQLLFQTGDLTLGVFSRYIE